MCTTTSEQKARGGAEYLMATTIAIWLAASLIVLRGNLRGRDLAYTLNAATASTFAVWWINQK